MACAVQADHLVKTYPGDIRALDDLSISVEAGEILGLLGPNGAGKSTTIKILTTLIRPGSGSARPTHSWPRPPAATPMPPTSAPVRWASTYRASACAR